MAHYHEVNAESGDLIDLIVFCSDNCHWSYCHDNDLDYAGWNGCHELEFSEYCAQCCDSIAGVNGWE